MSYCVERWSLASRRRAYSLMTFALQFCLPLTATVILYTRIYTRLRARCQLPVSSSVIDRHNKDTNDHRRRSNRTKRTTRILVAIVVSFVACWLPWNVLSLVTELDRSAVSGRNFELIELGLKIFALIGSACINPIFYCWLNDGFRAELSGSLGNVRLRLLSKTEVGRQMSSVCTKQHRPDTNGGGRHLSKVDEIVHEVDGVSAEPRGEVCCPASLVDDKVDESLDQDVSTGDVSMHKHRMNWCLASARYEPLHSTVVLSCEQLASKQ